MEIGLDTSTTYFGYNWWRGFIPTPRRLWPNYVPSEPAIARQESLQPMCSMKYSRGPRY